jgi:mitochondrial chaperone BCS1
MVEQEAEADDAPQLQYSPAPGFHIFYHRGRLMWMQREIAMNMQIVETIRLSAVLARRRLLEELLERVARHAGERRANRLTLYTVDRWGDEWRLVDSKPRRSLYSVVRRGRSAAAARRHPRILHPPEWDAQMGIPWRRGYLLYGPPGTGKTSAAYALAGERHLKLCALSLTTPS